MKNSSWRDSIGGGTYKGYTISGENGYAIVRLNGKVINENFTSYAAAQYWCEQHPMDEKQNAAVEQKLFLSFKGKKYPVASIAEAQDAWDNIRDAAIEQGMGNRDLSEDPLIVNSYGKKLHALSWNGSLMNSKGAGLNRGNSRYGAKQNAFKVGDASKKDAYEEQAKRSAERSKELIAKLEQKAKEDPSGIWADLLAEAKAGQSRENARGILPPPGSALDDKPMASAGNGQTGPERSYRYPSSFGGWIMIGAGSTQEALSEAKRSLSDGSSPTLDKLQKWDGSTYVRAK